MGLEIGGVSRDAELSLGSLRHLNALGQEPDTLEIDLISGATQPTTGAEVIYTTGYGSRLFGGVLVSAPQSQDGMRSMRYGVSALDWRQRVDRLLVNERWLARTPGQIIVDAFAKYAPDFDTSMVDLGGAVIPSISFRLTAYLTDVLRALSELTGWIWDIDPDKRVIWGPPGAVPAPWGLTDTSYNFSDLVVTPSLEQLRNHVIVKGGTYASSKAITQQFQGDGLTASFPLIEMPHGTEEYTVLKGDFTSGIGAEWVVTDTSNPTPPAGHLSSDGYLFTTTQQGAALTESGWLQIVGGSGSWGAERLMSFDVFDRGDGARRFEWEVSATTSSGSGRFGLWDPNTQTSTAGEQYGFFLDNGTVRASIGGVTQTPAATITYAAGTQMRLRIVPKAGGGAKLWVNKDSTGDTGLPADQRVAWRASQWVLLLDTNTGSMAQFTFAGHFGHSFNGRARRMRVFNPLYGITLTVGGTSKLVGLLGTDEDAGVDALVGISTGRPYLSFFGDTKPGSGVACSITYYPGERVRVQRRDQDSINAMAALMPDPAIPLNQRGVFQHLIEDANLNTPELARRRAAQELEQFANPLVTVSFKTRQMGLRAGQLLSVSLTAAASGRDLVGQYLIQSVETQSLGGGVFEASVTATSRLKGVQDYLAELLRAGRKRDAVSDENEPLEEFLFQADSFSFSDSFTIAEGLLAPYRYAVEPTFARASVRYDPFTGALVASGVPGYVTLAGTVGVLVEEGTVNVYGASGFLTSDSNSDGVADGMLAYSTGTASGTRSMSAALAAPGFAACQRIQVTSSGGTTGDRFGIRFSGIASGAAATTTFTFKVFVEALSPGAIVRCYSEAYSSANAYLGSAPRVLSSVSADWETVSFSITNASQAKCLSYVWIEGGTGSVRVQVMQAEAKAYATSLINGTRAAETITVPTDGALDAASGSVEVRIYVDAVLAANIGNRTARAWMAAPTTAPYPGPGFTRYQDRWRFAFINAAGTQANCDYQTTSLPVGWHVFRCSWGPGGLVIACDGVQVATAAMPAGPYSLGSLLYVGGWFNNTNLNSSIDYLQATRADGVVTRLTFNGSINDATAAKYGRSTYTD